MKYDEWVKTPSRFLSLTGYNIERFKELMEWFREQHDIYYSKYDLNGKRKTGGRKNVIYSNSPLPSVEERLVFILSYKKLNPLQEQHGALFGMTQKQCGSFAHSLTKVLELSLEASGSMPATTSKGLVEKLIQMDRPSAVHLLHDGTEREIPRPQDCEEQKEKYSGKKKKHTLKNGVVTGIGCLILFVSASVSGKVHDKKIADGHYMAAIEQAQRHMSAQGKPVSFFLYQDTGFQGFAPEGVTTIQPFKKPKGMELTTEQKEHNRKVSSFRVRVEHAIGSAKRYRMVKDECRLRKNKYPEKYFLFVPACIISV